MTPLQPPVSISRQQDSTPRYFLRAAPYMLIPASAETPIFTRAITNAITGGCLRIFGVWWKDVTPGEGRLALSHRQHHHWSPVAISERIGWHARRRPNTRLFREARCRRGCRRL